MPKNYHDWVHWNYVCWIVKETVRVISLHNIFCRFLNFPTDFYLHNWDSKSRACYKVYWVDKLTDNWNLYKKESTRPELTLYLPSAENMVAYILWWLAIIFISKILVLTRYCKWETSNNQANIAGSVYSVRNDWNRSNGVVPRQGQHFNTVLLFMITLAGRA